MSFVEFVTDMKAQTFIGCHSHAFEYFGGVTRRVLYDNMKTVVLERDASGEGQHRLRSGFLDYAHHCGFIIKYAVRTAPGPRAVLSVAIANIEVRH